VKNHVEVFIMSNDKMKQVKLLGLLQPLTMPNRKGGFNSMDFIVDLSRTQKRFDSNFVIDNRLSKVVQFIPTTTTVISSGVAELFFKEMSELWVDARDNL
jgi:hypothetical protein